MRSTTQVQEASADPRQIHSLVARSSIEDECICTREFDLHDRHAEDDQGQDQQVRV